MSLREKAPTILTAEGARRKIARARDALALADDLLVELYEGRAWEALGHESWAALCAAELPELRMIKALPLEVRAEKWAGQVRAGLSQAAVADAAGVGKATMSRALQGKELPTTATGLDGKVRPTRSTVPPRNGSPTPPAKPEQRVAIILRMAAAGPLTVASLKGATGWGHEVASPALSRLAASGRLVYLPGVKRGRMGSYSLPLDARSVRP